MGHLGVLYLSSAFVFVLANAENVIYADIFAYNNVLRNKRQGRVRGMEHLGDITALSGYTAMPVDVVIGGSPCQDLSLAARAESNPHPSVWCLQGNAIDRSDTAGCNGKGWKEGVSYTLNTIDRHGVCILQQGIARRLTPLEWERLQGFPDNWTDIGAWTDGNGKVHEKCSDHMRYKALGNSIAIPPWTWVLTRLCAQYRRPATMASLFDGIGGFPLIWERHNGKGSCLWVSEIEPFPIAVTKYHFSP